MGTTAQKLQAILDSKADIAAALEEKHAVVPETLAEYGDAIRAISQNDAPNIRNPVKFVDYDGTLLHSYGVQAALALEELPELPTRPGLTNQGWNYTLAQLKTQVNTIGKAIVGCNYITTDGRTRFHITIPNSTFTVNCIPPASSRRGSSISRTNCRYSTDMATITPIFIVKILRFHRKDKHFFPSVHHIPATFRTTNCKPSTTFYIHRPTAIQPSPTFIHSSLDVCIFIARRI